jgi:hypothetical protein
MKISSPAAYVLLLQLLPPFMSRVAAFDVAPNIMVSKSMQAGTASSGSIDSEIYNGDTSLVNSLRVYLATRLSFSGGPPTTGADFFHATCTFFHEHPSLKLYSSNTD